MTRDVMESGSELKVEAAAVQMSCLNVTQDSKHDVTPPLP